MAKTPVQNQPVENRKSATHRAKQQSVNRYVFIGTIIVAALVLVVILFGLLDTFYLKGNRAVAAVNGEKVTLKEFEARARYTRNNLVQTFLSNLPMYEAFASDPNLSAQFKSQLQEIMLKLDVAGREQLGQEVIDQLVNERLVSQEAQKRGLTVTEDEITAGLQEAFGFFPNGTPVPSATPTMVVTSTLSATQLALMPPTATATLSPTATQLATASSKATALPVASETPAPSLTETAVSTEELNLPTTQPTLTLTPTEYTVDVYKKNLDEFLKGLKDVGYGEAEIRTLIKNNLLRKKVFEAVTAEVALSEEQVWARHILVETGETAKEVLQKLKDGQDFAKLAAEYSKDTSNKESGGDLGWFSKGQMVKPFEEAAWALEISQISEPVKTDFGYHIIQVLGHEERALSASGLQQKKNTVFSDWLKGLNTPEAVKPYDLWKANVPMQPVIPPERIPATLMQ